MPQIKVDPIRISELSTKERSIQNKSFECQASVKTAMRSLDWEVATKASINTRLDKLQKRLQAQTGLMDSYANVLGTVNDRFGNKDRSLKQDARELIYEMNSITASLALATGVLSKINFKADDMLNRISSVANLFTQKAIIGATTVDLMFITKIPNPSPSPRDAINIVKDTNVKAGWWDRVKSGASNIGKKAVKMAGGAVSRIKEEIGPGGRFEGAWLSVKTTTKIVGASAFIAVSAASVALGNPAGVMGVIYGVNSFANAATDMHRIDQGKYDEVGSTNYLKSGMKKGAEAIAGSVAYGAGYMVGGADTAAEWGATGAQVGKTVGSVAYEIGDIYSKVAVGSTVIGDSKAVYSKLKDVLDMGNSSKVYDYIEKVVKWVDDPAKEAVKIIVPSAETNIGEMAEKASEKIISALIKPIK